MITLEDARANVGRTVVYTREPNSEGEMEAGEITSVNSAYVFVRYWGDDGSKATRPEDLSWRESA